MSNFNPAPKPSASGSIVHDPETQVSILDLKKGTRVLLNNSWYATLEDNLCRQATRLATVEGIVTEMGSVYSHDIIRAKVDGKWKTVVHTPSQIKCRTRVKAFGW